MARDAQRQRGGLKLVESPEPDPRGVLLPHDITAEESVIGGAMTTAAGGDIGAGMLEIALDLLRPEHFFAESSQIIWHAIGRLASEGKPVDPESVVGKLRDMGKLALAGGAPYIAKTLGECSVLNAKHYRARCERILDLSERRSLIRTCQRIAAEGYGADALQSPTWREQSIAAVQELALSGVRGRAVSMQEAMREGVAEATAMAESISTVYGYATKIQSLDDQTGGCVVPGELTVISGVSGEGKSSLSRQILVNVANAPAPDPEREGRHILNVCLLSTLEMKRGEVSRYMACTYAGVDGRKIRTKHYDEHARAWVSNMTEDDWRRFHRAAKWIERIPIFVEDDRKRTLAQLRAELRAKQTEIAQGMICPFCADGGRCKARIALLVVDTLQILAKNEPSLSRDEEYSDKLDRVTRDLGTTAVDFNIAVIALSQVNASGGAYGSPGAIRAHAQTMLSAKYQKKKSDGARMGDTTAQHDATITIDKCRAGFEGIVPLWYRPAYTRFEE